MITLGRLAAVAILLGVLSLGRLGPGSVAADDSHEGGHFTIRSADFANGTPIPVVHACTTLERIAGAENVPFTLRWKHPPRDTLSFVLEVVDRDPPTPPLGGFVHWLVYNIPATASEIGPESLSTGTQGTNTLGQVGYLGPCPPQGNPPHHYRITLYALGTARVIGTFQVPQQ
jgi:Raf kinase inhibitor-like YbhB/YbcL family protein